MMNKRKNFFFSTLMLSLMVALILGGCTRQQSPQPPSGAALKTCAELGGYECDAGEDCPETWLDASDTFRCCECVCESAVDEADFLEIDAFEETPDDEELGEVYE